MITKDPSLQHFRVCQSPALCMPLSLSLTYVLVSLLLVVSVTFVLAPASRRFAYRWTKNRP
jgi:hypothetical protein